jgi:hypothetical protein
MASLAIDTPVLSERDVVANLVERYLERHQKPDYRIVVRRDAIQRMAGRWLVEIAVEPTNARLQAGEFIERFSAANEDLDRDYPRYITLTQLVPQPGEVL